MELISESFNWCERGRRSGIDLGDKVLSGALQKEEEVIVKIRANVKNEVHKY